MKRNNEKLSVINQQIQAKYESQIVTLATFKETGFL